MITHFETPDPGTTYLSTLEQKEDGHLTAKKTECVPYCTGLL
jgi:hypothetical protein